MSLAFSIREATPSDHKNVLEIYPAAFPDEDMSDLVMDLLTHIESVNLVAVIEGSIVGHAAYARCRSTDGSDFIALLGPLCVDVAHHRSGIGSALIQAGAARLMALGCSEILVLGDHRYYGPCGFDVRSEVEPPYPLKTEWLESWRSMSLGDRPRASGTLIPPALWMKPEHWA